VGYIVPISNFLLITYGRPYGIWTQCTFTTIFLHTDVHWTTAAATREAETLVRCLVRQPFVCGQTFTHLRHMITQTTLEKTVIVTCT
jgi:hypothetical protein